RAREAVPDLVEALRRGDLDSRDHPDNLVVDALAGIGPDAAPAIPLLAERFRKEECYLAKQGSFGIILFSGPKYALVRIGAASVRALAGAREKLAGGRRPGAAGPGGERAPPAAAAVPALIRTLRRDVEDIQTHALRRQAVIALGRIGPAAPPAVPALNDLLN